MPENTKKFLSYLCLTCGQKACGQKEEKNPLPEVDISRFVHLMKVTLQFDPGRYFIDTDFYKLQALVYLEHIELAGSNKQVRGEAALSLINLMQEREEVYKKKQVELRQKAEIAARQAELKQKAEIAAREAELKQKAEVAAKQKVQDKKGNAKSVKNQVPPPLPDLSLELPSKDGKDIEPPPELLDQGYAAMKNLCQTLPAKDGYRL